jgi:hypothetical protein
VFTSGTYPWSFVTQILNNCQITMGATSGSGTAYPSGAPAFTLIFSGVRITRSLVICVCFVDRCLSFCTFSFGHCVVCSSLKGPGSAYDKLQIQVQVQ